jgi:hypothetical protein
LLDVKVQTLLVVANKDGDLLQSKIRMVVHRARL